MQRLGKNQGGYRGETIDISAVLREIQAGARQHGWTSESFHTEGKFNCLGLLRRATSPVASRPTPQIYVSTGIHGDEPAGPLAVLRLLRENCWPASADLFLCPCLNPTGFALNQRANDQGLDLNRDYRHFKSAEVRAHVAWLAGQPPFDVTFCLHEDWESHGFYVYALNPDGRPSLAETMVEAASRCCPLDLSPVIEGREASNGIIRPSLDPNSRPEWPEAFWLIQNKTRQSYTLEAPSDFPMPVRVNALVAAVNSGFGQWLAQPSGDRG